MAYALITGSCGLIGSEAAKMFSEKGLNIIGIDNDMRGYFFGKEASTASNKECLEKELADYKHFNLDIRDRQEMEKIFKEYNKEIVVVIHTAAQPSHDWAANEPMTDFTVNANGTLNLLELTRCHAPHAVFIFTSSNKVYGDRPNSLPFIELETRWDLPEEHVFYNGIDETLPMDQSNHSLYGVSKASADLLVQEYGRYFGIHTGCFRGGCLTGPMHAGATFHGFLSYLVKCCVREDKYTIYGYKGKQVRDNIHSRDLVNAFYKYYQNPKKGEVYNMGGGRANSCSVLEAISLCEDISGKTLDYEFVDKNRFGDHQWYITSTKKFQSHYPEWSHQYSLDETLRQIYDNNVKKWESMLEGKHSS